MKYRKKPVVVEAIQFTQELRDACLFDGVPLPDGVRIRSASTKNTERRVYSASFYISTLEGAMDVSLNDWIITGIQGEHYPCSPDVFYETYDELGEM